MLAAHDSEGLAERFGARLQFGTAGLRGPLGAGAEPHEPRSSAGPRPGWPPGCTSGTPTGSRRAWWSGSTPGTSPTSSPRTRAAVLAGAGIPSYLLPATAPHPVLAFGVRHLGGGRGDGDRQPQPADGQRLQGLRPLGCPDRAADRHRDLRRHRRGRPAGRRTARRARRATRPPIGPRCATPTSTRCCGCSRRRPVA